VAAVIIVAIFGYEFFVANSLSGYTKVSITSSQPYSINFSNTASAKFGNTVYYITFLHSVFQVLFDNSSRGFGAIQGAKYSFSGLQIVVGSVNDNQLILYVKSTISNSEPIISSMPTPTVSPSISIVNLPTPSPYHGFVATPVSIYNCSFSVLNPQVTEVSGYNSFYNNVSQGMSLEVKMTFNSITDQPITIPIENLTISYYNNTVDLHRWINNDGSYSIIQQQAFNYSFSLNRVTVQPFMSNSNPSDN
jgi:hypothetical protein